MTIFTALRLDLHLWMNKNIRHVMRYSSKETHGELYGERALDECFLWVDSAHDTCAWSRLGPYCQRDDLECVVEGERAHEVLPPLIAALLPCPDDARLDDDGTCVGIGGDGVLDEIRAGPVGGEEVEV